MNRNNILNFLRNDIVIATFLTLLALIPRLIFLDQLPSGIHGDEGWTGIDAMEITSGKWISLYSGDALGQPTGPLYFTALLFKIFGSSIFTLRLSMALLGTLTIPLFYFLLRHFFPRRISFLATFAFAFSLIHLHYSRIAFMLISGPIFEIMSLLLLFKGQKTNKLWYFGLAGFFLGIGLYSYNAFLIMPAVFIFLLLCQTTVLKNQVSFRQFGLFTLTTLLFSLPLIYIMVTEPGFYFAHHKLVSVFSSTDFKNLPTFMGKGMYLISNGLTNLRQFFLGRVFDASDGFGGFYNFNAPYIVFILIGIIIAFIEKKKEYLFVITLFLLYSTTSIFFTGSVYRRLFLTIPLFYFFMAVFLNRILMVKRHLFFSTLLFTATTIIVVSESITNIQTYFIAAKTESVSSTFTSSLTRTFITLQSMRERSDIILLYSKRWPCKYETIRFLAPEIHCIDRSAEYGDFVFSLPDESKTVHFLLLEDYQNSYKKVRLMYPEGKSIEVRDNGKKIAVIYTVKKTF